MSIFENKQWAVREWGLQSVKPGAPYEYNIDAHRLLERVGAGGGKHYDWPVHMAEKTWIDLEAFIEAYRAALAAHAGVDKGDVDEAMLEASIQAGRDRIANRPKLEALMKDHPWIKKGGSSE